MAGGAWTHIHALRVRHLLVQYDEATTYNVVPHSVSQPTTGKVGGAYLTDWMVFTAGTVAVRGMPSGAAGPGGTKPELEAMAGGRGRERKRRFPIYMHWLIRPSFIPRPSSQSRSQA